MARASRDVVERISEAESILGGAATSLKNLEAVSASARSFSERCTSLCFNFFAAFILLLYILTGCFAMVFSYDGDILSALGLLVSGPMTITVVWQTWWGCFKGTGAQAPNAKYPHVALLIYLGVSWFFIAFLLPNFSRGTNIAHPLIR